MELATAAIIGQILTFVTVMMGFLMQYIREGRQHRWDMQERIDVAAKLLASSESGKAQSRESEARLTSKIDENTDISKTAFNEANGINNKLHALGLAQQLAQATATAALLKASTEKEN